MLLFVGCAACPLGLNLRGVLTFLSPPSPLFLSSDNFIGNSVSTWSALQTCRFLKRSGMATWYNSHSIPLASVLDAFTIPIVYTYTEASAGTGKIMLQTSILSCRKMNPGSVIHILYNGREDLRFILWLKEHGVTVHHHVPKWADAIEEMRMSGDITKSHLFSHPGNYLGTWQRIDIPLHINAEYVLLLDADTVITTPFTFADFGLKITKSVAFSAEMDEDDDKPWNAGVALMNLPHLRETYDGFLEFILEHSDGSLYKNNAPSDQGAYLEYYEDTIQFLDKKFNVKPYWQNKIT